MSSHRCGKCGDLIVSGNRSRWSPYFCGPCDLVRRNRITAQLQAIVQEDRDREAREAAEDLSPMTRGTDWHDDE